MIHDKLTHFKLMLLIPLQMYIHVKCNTPGTLNSAVKCKVIENIRFHRHGPYQLSKFE